MKMHGKKLLGLATGNLLLALLVIVQHTPNVASTRMLSTSTQAPESLTTPKHSADNRAAVKAAVTDFVTLAVSMKNIKSIEDLLTNSSLINNMEKSLNIFLDIVHTVEEFYGYRLRQESSRACSFEYAKQKRFLLRELTTVLTDCKETMDNVDVLHFTKTEGGDKVIIHACLERTRTIPRDIIRLIDQSYEISYVCALESVRILVEELLNTKFFTFVIKNSKLLIQELEYSLKTFETTMLENSSPEENNAKSSALDMLMNRKAELQGIKNIMHSGIMEQAIENFTQTAEKLLHANLTLEKAASQKDAEVYPKVLDNSLKEEIFDKHLKVPSLEDNSAESLARSPGLYKVVHMNNILKEMLTKTALSIPKSGVFRRAQLDLNTAKLFTDISPTFGKHCVNSPHHLVGTCTAKNHEICRHVVVNWGTDDDQELLPEEELLLLGSLELKHCTCGFRTSCKHDDRRGTCFLIPNSDGQCRGGEGYPCRTNPLEPGRYDESCVSGYCNRQENMCQMDPYGEVGLQKMKRIVKKKLEHLAKFFRKM